jgi:hypothetical protein
MDSLTTKKSSGRSFHNNFANFENRFSDIQLYSLKIKDGVLANFICYRHGIGKESFVCPLRYLL